MIFDLNDSSGRNNTKNKVFNHVIISDQDFRNLYTQLDNEHQTADKEYVSTYFPNCSDSIADPHLTIRGSFKTLDGEDERHYQSIDDFIDIYDGRTAGIYELKFDSMHFGDVDITQTISSDPLMGAYDSFLKIYILDSDDERINRILHLINKMTQSGEQLKPQSDKIQPHIFIGHGRSEQWKELRDYLRDEMGYIVRTYESESHASQDIKEILSKELECNNYAILVMTGDDKLVDGSFHARQNVVHEAGLFQGRLGFEKVLILLEQGTKMFTNLDGLQYISFPKGQVQAAEGRTVAAIVKAFDLNS